MSTTASISAQKVRPDASQAAHAAGTDFAVPPPATDFPLRLTKRGMERLQPWASMSAAVATFANPSLPPRDDSIVLDYQHGQGPRVTTFVELRSGMDVFLIETVETAQLPDAHARLREVLDKRLPYDAIEANCQHAAVYVARGAWESPQVRGLGTLLLVGAGVAILSDLGEPKRTARRRKPR